MTRQISHYKVGQALTISLYFPVWDEKGTAGPFLFFARLLICDAIWMFSSGKNQLTKGENDGCADIQEDFPGIVVDFRTQKW